MQVGTTLINRYRILQKLGGGSFGDTYLVEDGNLPGNLRRVVKHLQPKTNDPRAIFAAKRLFERKAVTLYQLGHKSDRIPTLFAHFEEEGQFYLVQEFIEGRDLGEELIPGKPLKEWEVCDLLMGILEALEVAHSSNVIHRDIKPRNLMRRKEDGKIVLMDFGAIKEIGSLIVNGKGDIIPTFVVGTPGYMPGEQSQGSPNLSSDIYAVGIIGIQALAGMLPDRLLGESKTEEEMEGDRVLVSDELGDFLEKMVCDDFSWRFVDAMEARSALVATEVSPPPPSLLLAEGTRRETFTTVVVNPQGQIMERLLGEVEILRENLDDEVTLEMVSIPGGEFIMGSPSGDGYDWETPEHEVVVPPFFLGKYPVTQGQYEAVMGENPSYFKGANCSVENVLWEEATEFCRKLSERTGKIYRLPSEAEWEYACRAGTTTPFYFGPTITTELANYNGRRAYGFGPKGVGRGKTTEVGSFPPNGFGLYDMHGNVWEWCQDLWHGSYEGAPTDGSAWESDGDSPARVLRGGSLGLNPRNCRCAVRFRSVAGDRGNVVGFRVVMVFGV